MAKRVFTKVLSCDTAMHFAGSHSAPAVGHWLAQEDIEIIGYTAQLACSQRSQNDGESYIEAELSQVGIHDSDGSLGLIIATEGWNTAPQGIEKASAHKTVMFPAGYAVPIKEEGSLYVNVVGFNKSAGSCVYKGDFVVFYTKRGG